jgi:hypothetical protein
MKLIVLAHPDDEIFVLPFIVDDESKIIVFLTNGVSRFQSQKKLKCRSLEANRVFFDTLRKFNCDVLWWGNDKICFEGELHLNMNEQFFISFYREISKYGHEISEVVTTTYEGAHQDHDSAAYISRKIANRFNLVTTEVSTYPQKFRFLYSFTVLHPKFKDRQIDFDRLVVLRLAIRLMFSYRSQLTTWLGLGPFILFRYAFKPYFTACVKQIEWLNSCFYETRSRASQSEVLKYLQ